MNQLLNFLSLEHTILIAEYAILNNNLFYITFKRIF